MSLVNKLETAVGGWLKPVPHLPGDAQKWIAENAWWIAIVSALASVISVFVTVGSIMTYVTLMNAFVGYYSVQAYSEGWMVMSLLTLSFTIATTVLTALAVHPLKQFQKKGWNWLFLVLIVNAVAVVVKAVAKTDPTAIILSVILGAIVVAIGAYFLFEIRSYFVKSTKAAPVTTK